MDLFRFPSPSLIFFFFFIFSVFIAVVLHTHHLMVWLTHHLIGLDLLIFFSCRISLKLRKHSRRCFGTRRSENPRKWRDYYKLTCTTFRWTFCYFIPHSGIDFLLRCCCCCCWFSVSDWSTWNTTKTFPSRRLSIEWHLSLQREQQRCSNESLAHIYTQQLALNGHCLFVFDSPLWLIHAHDKMSFSFSLAKVVALSYIFVWSFWAPPYALGRPPTCAYL
jgi:hypothetical protein